MISRNDLASNITISTSKTTDMRADMKADSRYLKKEKLCVITQIRKKKMLCYIELHQSLISQLALHCYK